MKKLHVITIALVMSGTISSLTYSMDEGWDTQKTYYITGEEKTSQIIPQTGITKPTTGSIFHDKKKPYFTRLTPDEIQKEFNDFKQNEILKKIRGGNIEEKLNYRRPDSNFNFSVTPLTFSAANGYADLVRGLISQNATVNTQNKYETTPMTTPLIEAARNNHPEIVKLLLDAGADTTLTDNDGKTALYYAQKNKNQDIEDYLLGKKPVIAIEKNPGYLSRLYQRILKK